MADDEPCVHYDDWFLTVEDDGMPGPRPKCEPDCQCGCDEYDISSLTHDKDTKNIAKLIAKTCRTAPHAVYMRNSLVWGSPFIYFDGRVEERQCRSHTELFVPVYELLFPKFEILCWKLGYKVKKGKKDKHRTLGFNRKVIPTKRYVCPFCAVACGVPVHAMLIRKREVEVGEMPEFMECTCYSPSNEAWESIPRQSYKMWEYF